VTTRATFEDDGLVSGWTRLDRFVAGLESAGLRVALTPGEMTGSIYAGASRLDVLEATGATVTVRIELLDVEGSHSELKLRVEGEAADVEAVQAALMPVLTTTLWKYRDAR
jgi:hypothetical protein